MLEQLPYWGVIAGGLILAAAYYLGKPKMPQPDNPPPPPVDEDERLRLVRCLLEVRDAIGHCGDCAKAIDSVLIPAILTEHGKHEQDS